ncbi:bifunctional helix-turn-helix domain-containing protein/methylated-DNA--[protein]-cysteine S-methyltransferase [Thalassomonas actiniarum]|uniref:Methylated-DNA--[protein]-cysteine S-methyltransferase n=1 Tax=Thalassomonas actiniarum TaxID=485447 RepID=A0AAE9YSX7_9GAMM|nr:methylated-DNA--[protein]-cysteine S-methyltransferase [Thalassomonas actiniarum]WDD99689.1 methylated-DNA--[protein]-cysteine S-methyltransferase [Thalassomonas actiniarum]
MNKVESHRHYLVVEQAIAFIHRHFAKQPTLTDIAEAVHMSEHHLQRVFSEWAGISPKRFLQFITKQAAIDALKNTSNLIEASQSLGLSGTGRLHDLLVTCEGMTPGEMKRAGEGVAIDYGVASTPFGEAVLAWTGRGICYLQFVEREQQTRINDLFQQWPHASFTLKDEAAGQLSEKIFASPLERGKIHLVLKGTNFQVKVWEALINSQASQQLSYSQVAQLVGSPGASRAVGTALASNTIGYLIPCHRVIKSNGELGNYRWGVDRKSAMLGWERAQTG